MTSIATVKNGVTSPRSDRIADQRTDAYADRRPTAFLHGHRGASADAPENTIAAFRLALEQGADGIELDVQLSADGVPIVIHDRTLSRTAGRPEAIRELKAPAITAADTFPLWSLRRSGSVRGGPTTHQSASRDTTDTRVPTLERALAWLPEGCGLVIDVKDAAAVAAIVGDLGARPGAPGEARLISFLPAAIQGARRTAPWLHTGLLLEPGESIGEAVAWAADLGHASVVPWDPQLGEGARLRRTVEAAAGRGVSIGTYGVDDADRARELRAAGVEFVMTDHPARLAGTGAHAPRTHAPPDVTG